MLHTVAHFVMQLLSNLNAFWQILGIRYGYIPTCRAPRSFNIKDEVRTRELVRLKIVKHLFKQHGNYYKCLTPLIIFGV